MVNKGSQSEPIQQRHSDYQTGQRRWRCHSNQARLCFENGHASSRYFLGPASQNDNTAKIESQIQRRLLKLKTKNLIPAGVYEAIRPTGSQRLRMYSLPKTHKKDAPLRLILSMTGSSQHQLAKWLTFLLDPVLQVFSPNCIPNSFTFVETQKFSIFYFITISLFL